MSTISAINIVKKCMDYNHVHGVWPTPKNYKQKKNNVKAFLHVNHMISCVGDFSFVTNDVKREALQHDYNVITELNAWSVLRYHDPLDEFVTDTYGGIWNEIFRRMWPHHNRLTAIMSLRTLEYISKNGWESYILNKN